jgi:hypothetical protein
MPILFRHGSPSPIRGQGSGPVQVEVPQGCHARGGTTSTGRAQVAPWGGRGAGTSGHFPGSLRLTGSEILTRSGLHYLA